MPDPAPILKRLGEILAVPGDRVGKARRITSAVRETGGYRWVGLLDVSEEGIRIVAWSGPGPPAFPRLHSGQGLCGATVQSRQTTHVGDVTRDPRYVTTLNTTRSEIVTPVLDAAGAVVGLLDVESDLPDAFGPEDTKCLEACARALAPLWS